MAKVSCYFVLKFLQTEGVWGIVRKENETCIQRVRFDLEFFTAGAEQWPVAEVTKKQPQPQSLRALGRWLDARFERIALMMEVLTGLHDQWTISAKKDRVSMETETLDFADAVAALKERGFKESEYTLKVEYLRKWGVL